MRNLPALFLFLLPALALSLQFSSAPTFVKDAGSTWKIEFTVSEYTDVEVSIVNKTTKSCVRHLAAGVLGSNPPAPLTPSSLSQTIIWDGLDDYRNPVPSPENMSVRVRAGMSVSLDNAVGGDPYHWSGQNDVAGTNFYGFSKGSDGSIFLCYLPNSIAATVVRQFSATGSYLKTIFPIPGDKPSANYLGWGLNLLSTNEYSPKTKDFYGPLMSNAPMGVFGCRPQFIMSPAAGQLGFLHEYQNTIWTINEDGTCSEATAASSKSLGTIPFRYFSQPRFFTGSPDRSYFLISGLSDNTDTGFYREGRIFKVDIATRTPTVFFSLDTLKANNSANQSYIHGTAIDDSGYVFACDRLHGRIMVIDKNGTLIKNFKASYPDDIAYHKETGAVYATGRHSTIGLYLYKIANWRTDTALSIKTSIAPAGGGQSYLQNGWYDRSFLTVTESLEGTIIWFAYRMGGIKLFKENGTLFTEYKTFAKLSQTGTPTIKRISVDPKTETAYVVSSGTQVHKISDWSNPSFVPCSTLSATGVKAPLNGYELTVDPLRRNLFLRQIGVRGPFEGNVNRFTFNGNYLTPAPLSRSGSNTVVDSYCVRGTMSVGTADFGIAVAPNGHLATMTALPYIGLTPTAVRYFPISDTQSAIRRLILIDDIKVGGGGISFDLKGNLYVGKPIKSTGSGLPSVITSDPSFLKSSGSIQRYNVNGSLNGELFTSKPTGPDKSYDVDLGQLGGGTMSICDCMTASFGMDAWGRLYVPNGPFQKISVIDNEGNRTARFGTYGNIGNVADELAGAPNTAGKCYMAYPFCVNSTDDYIYATDPGNIMITRFKKNFVLDNVPSMSTTAARNPLSKGQLALFVSPNPFSGICRIGVSLPLAERVSLTVVDPSGRIVKQVAAGSLKAGYHTFSWDGTKSAAGVYFYKLTAGNKVVTARVLSVR